jgi:nicotinamide mononucleotide transporter
MNESLKILEWVAAFLSLWCVWLAAKNRIINWPVSMLASILYANVFYNNRFYSESFLQAIFFAFQSFGWWYWSSLNPKKTSQLIRKTPTKTAKYLLYCFFLGYLLWYTIYTYLFKDARFPLIDVFLTVLSITALYMQAKRWIEHWYLWIIADIIYVPMFYLGDQKITSGLYLIFIGLAFYGLKQWKKEKAAQGGLSR